MKISDRIKLEKSINSCSPIFAVISNTIEKSSKADRGFYHDIIWMGRSGASERWGHCWADIFQAASEVLKEQSC